MAQCERAKPGTSFQPASSRDLTTVLLAMFVPDLTKLALQMIAVLTTPRVLQVTPDLSFLRCQFSTTTAALAAAATIVGILLLITVGLVRRWLPLRNQWLGHAGNIRKLH